MKDTAAAKVLRVPAGRRLAFERAWLSVLALSAGIACSSNGGSSDTQGKGGSATGGSAVVGTGGGAGTSAAGNGGAGGGGSTGGSSAAGGTGGGSKTSGTGGVAGGGTGGTTSGSNGTGGVPGTGSGGTTVVAGAGGNGTGTSVAGAGGTGAGGTGAVASGGAGGTGTGTGTSVADTVTRKTSTFTFKHFPIQTSSDGVWNGPSTPGTQATSTAYETMVLENGYLKVTLLPEYGGRILSILHKPTDQELLYQNPIGTPYLMGEDIFYYNYLVIMGGIFASFPEPEHGKYWNQPYDLKVVSESQDAITVRMSRKDDLPLAAGVPSKYDVGRTDVLVEVDVTLRAGSTSVELGTKLTNTQSKAVAKFEYWTTTTLAPGSPPDKTTIPLNTRIMAAMDKVHLLESSWSWFGNAEERVSGEVFKWNNLSYFKNWADQGTAFANPDYRANWSGLINYDAGKGIIRVSDNVKTPGLKLWTFGKQSLTADISKSAEWLRPTIEMWHGITTEFWNRGTMAANEVRQWTQHFFPTFGIKEVTAASDHGVLYLSTSKGASETALNLTATLTLPKQTVKAVLRLNDTVVAEQDLVVSATDATTLSASVANAKATAGAILEAEFLQADKSLLSGQITLP